MPRKWPQRCGCPFLRHLKTEIFKAVLQTAHLTMENTNEKKSKRARLHNRVNREILLAQMHQSTEARLTVSFYKYYTIESPQTFRDALFLLLDVLGVKGRIYIAHEGINAQISLPENQFEAFKTQLDTIHFLKGVRLNTAVDSSGKSFFKLAIKVRPKIVADGLDDLSFDPSDTGTHLDAQAFNALTDDSETLLIDMRNHYESEVGYFENAIRPDAETFRDELSLAEKILDGKEAKNVVMYCTGGIRCEKASAWFKHKGFKNVFQLDGGIIQYAKQVKEQGLKNKFKGINFVFDERLGERVSEEIVAKCHQCGAACDQHVNCANDACHLLFIQCSSCAEKFSGCCAQACTDFIQLPEAEQKELRKTAVFNGTKFGKGRYKVHHESRGLLGSPENSDFPR
jgi:UPF0176 protein